MDECIAFIGGGNMASAIIGGLVQQGIAPASIHVVEPYVDAQAKLRASYGVTVHAAAGDFLHAARTVLWAVKPQTFREAAAAVKDFTPTALHVSVAAGIRSDSIAQWLGNECVVRSMPNTPALIGKGITGLFARDMVSAEQRQYAERLVASMGEFLWLDQESQLDAVTALSGSGPAYMFYFMEAMITAGVEMGLPPAQAHQLAVATFTGAGALAHASPETPQVLRERVTSKGGTTFAAISAMEASDMKALFVKAMHAAQQRAHAMGQEFA